jgi:hypothetical protein
MSNFSAESFNPVSRREFCQSVAVGAVALTGMTAVRQTELMIQSPVRGQVIQRQGYVAANAHDHNPGGPELGQAVVTIRGTWAGNAPARLWARTVLAEGCTGRAVDWTELGLTQQPLPFEHKITIPAGGWYRLELEARNDGGVVAKATVDRFGVGEVILISGQSYAAGANDAHLKIDDPLERTTLFDFVTGEWRTANDPFPHVDTGGTIWPPFANALQPLLRVPLGLINVAVGGTASRQWMPGEVLYQRFRDGGLKGGPARLVLWQQGESDVIDGTSLETYVERLKTIRASLAKDWGFEPPWLLAKSTLHPTVYNRPVEEGRIRAAIDQLWHEPGFAPGPDTDILAGENRGGNTSRRHFSPIGQERAGLMWFACVWRELHTA